MELKFSHVDIIVADLDKSVSYYRRVLGCKAAPKTVWNRNGFHVEYQIMFNGPERFYLVHPIAGNLKELMDAKGEGIIYRLVYTVEDIKAAYDELKSEDVQPEDENGEPMTEDKLFAPNGVNIVWLPKEFGGLSMELIERKGFEKIMTEQRALAQ